MNRSRALLSCVLIIGGVALATESVAASRRVGPVAPRAPVDRAEVSSSAEPAVESSVPPVDTSVRADVVAHHFDYYETSEGIAHAWSGDVGACVAGSVDVDYLGAALQRVNYFRSLAGLPGTVTLDAIKNDKCQEAALMMSANGQLDHTPPASWACYTSAGAEAAGSSNLAAGFASAWAAIDGFMGDRGQPEVGHRRWILYPRLVTSGFGATFGGAWNGYAMWVIGDWGTRPAEPQWVAWPPAGYVPYPVVYELWSFTIAGADFSNATVTVTYEGNDVASSVYSLTPGFGDPGLSWSVQGLPIPTTDRAYHVRVGNVMIDSQSHDFDYDVIVIDPNVSLGVDDVEPPLPDTESTGGILRVRNHPNPFTSGTTIGFYVTRTATVHVDIYNVLGRRVRRLMRSPRPVGWHSIDWDGRVQDGSPAAAGAYFARVSAGRQVVTRRLLLAR